MLKAHFGIGPMSTEVIESVYRYSNYQRVQLMLISSKNQIDHSGGYVNGWDTSAYAQFCQDMKKKYEYSDVKLCRDHCGPGFNGNFDLEDTYSTIKSDIDNNFDLIHIDFCHFKGSKEEQFQASKEAIERCKSLNADVLLEVGTDENEGTNFGVMNVPELKEEIDFFTSFCDPEFYVVQTGTLVKEINQVGNFNKPFMEKISALAKEKNLKIKEHNADYLSADLIKQRPGVIDAMNIAPQLGVLQTTLVLHKCLVYGISFSDFLDDVYNGGKWKKWMHNNDPQNKMLCAQIAGHYHFTSDSFKNIMDELEKREDIKENIINTHMELIDHYVSNYGK